MVAFVLTLTANADNIVFTDSHVKAVCVEHWDTNGDGELSEEEASAVISLHNYFSFDTQVTSFDELRYFTNLNSIHSIDFYSYSNLKTIQLSPQIESIGENTFRTSGRLESIDIPAAVTLIDVSAFNGCIRMERVSFHEGLVSIGNNAFSTCKTLQNIDIPASVTDIAINAFQACASVEHISVMEGNTVYDSREDCNAIIETKTNTLVLGAYTTIIPESVTDIGYFAFSGCAKLQSLEIPEGIITIGPSAFSNCSNLVSATLP